VPPHFLRPIAAPVVRRCTSYPHTLKYYLLELLMNSNLGSGVYSFVTVALHFSMLDCVYCAQVDKTVEHGVDS